MSDARLLLQVAVPHAFGAFALGERRRAAIWRRGAPRQVPLAGLARIPRRYFTDLHHRVSRDRLSEAMHVIEREQADVMVVGAVGARLNPSRLMYRTASLYNAHPLSQDPPGCIPFDQRRRGIVPAEGAAVLTLERRSHAVRRGATIIGQLLSVASGCGRPVEHYGGSAQALINCIGLALTEANCDTGELSHVSAQGFSGQALDRSEAAAIASTLGNVPVSAFSSYFGTPGATSSLMNLVASLLAEQAGMVLPVLGYNERDAECPLNVCRAAQRSAGAAFLTTSFTPAGQAAAAIIQCNR